MQYTRNCEQSPYTQFAEQHAHTRYNAISALFSYPPVYRYTVSSAIRIVSDSFLVKLRVRENRVIKIIGIMKETGRDNFTLVAEIA